MSYQILTRFMTDYPRIVESMKASNHNYSDSDINPYHAEGDVWTHTMMVFNVAVNNNYSNVVKLAALLHDIGKPSVRSVKDDTHRVRFFNHESVSFFMANTILQQSFSDILTQDEIKDVLFLVANHSVLFPRNSTDLLDQNYVMSIIGDNQNLASKLTKMCYCDSSGRIAKDSDDFCNILEKVDFELNDFNYQYEPREIADDAPTLTILIGLPACGKSTWVKKNKSHNQEVISRDDMMIYLRDPSISEFDYNAIWNSADHKKVDKEVQWNFNHSVKNGDNIIIDKTNLSKKARRKYVAPAKQHGYRINAIVFGTSMVECFTRSSNRDVNKSISGKVFDRMSKSFCFPLCDEVDSWEIIL